MKNNDILEIGSKDELINTLTNLACEKHYVFRGYSVQEQLYPTLIRKKAVSLENDLLYEFERYAAHYVNAANPIDFLSYAQHFGLSTRLLDFTYNPFIALYFSMFKAKPNNAKEPEDNTYYYIRYASLEDNICIREFPQKLAIEAMNDQPITPFPAGVNGSKAADCERWAKWFQDYFSKTKPKPTLLSSRDAVGLHASEDQLIDKLQKKPILFFDPNQSNQRLVMQQGLFMYPYSLHPNDHCSIVKRNTKLIKIHKNLRSEMQLYLNKMGINAFRLMPDLSSVCEAVERLVKEKRN